MEKLQFDSLYKFIVSIGLVIMLLPIAILTFVFNNEELLFIEADKLNTLSQNAQTIIGIRQQLMLSSLSSNGYRIMYGLMLFLGVAIMIVGIMGWLKVQKRLDEQTTLENEKLRNENNIIKKEFGMKKEEKIRYVRKEIEDDKIEGKNSKSVSVNEHIEVENLVALKIKDQFAKTHDVVQNVRLERFEYDVIARGIGFLEKDFIFEIKYTVNIISRSWLTRVINNFNERYESYQKITNRIPKRAVVIVTTDSNYEMVKSIVDDFSGHKFIHVISKENINDYNFN